MDVETTGSCLGIHSVVAVGAAVVEVSTGTVVETRRWTLDTRTAVWERRCTEEWRKHPDVLRDLTQPALPGVAVEPDAADVLLDAGGFATSWAKWLARIRAQFPSEMPIWSSFPAFDLAWLNFTLALSGVPPVYLSGPGGAWQPTLDLGAWFAGVSAVCPAALGVMDKAKLLYPDGGHYPEQHAVAVGQRTAYVYRALCECL